MKKHLLSIADLSAEEIKELFAISREIRHKHLHTARDKTLALVFEKPSLRTRVTFSVAFTQLGGHVIYLAPSDIGMGKRESASDVARNLSRWVNIIAARTFAHKTIEELALNSKVSVINALSDAEHPCQALGDFLSIGELLDNIRGLKLAFFGDGTNVCHSLMLIAAKLGTSMVVAGPKGYGPSEEYLNKAKEEAEKTGVSITVTQDPVEAAKDADVIYTDVWASMGKENEAKKRKPLFMPFQVNAKLLAHAKPNVLVAHCLPAHRGEEITDDVLDGPHSVVLHQAESRLYIQKGLLHKFVAPRFH